MARYSIADTTLTALGDAIRGKTGETEYRDIAYESKDYRLDRTHFYYDQYLSIPVDGAVSMQVTPISYVSYSGDFQIYAVNCTIPETITAYGTEPFMMTNFTSSDHVGLHHLISGDSGLKYNFSVIRYDADGNVIPFVVSEEVPKTMTPERMAAEINGMRVVDSSLLNLSGDISYKFYNGAWDSFITAYANDIVARQITSLNNTFYNTKLDRIPFEITGKKAAGIATSLKSMCQKSKLKEPPVLKYMKPHDVENIFDDCYYLREFPEGYGEDWDWSWHTSQTGGYSAARNGMFDNCYSLRQLPLALLKYTNPNLNYSYHTFREMNNLYVLDKATNLPCPITTAVNGTGYSGIFYNMFVKWCRCRSLTFADDIGPMKWAKQTIDLSQYFGWANSTSVILGYNSGITADKQVTDEASYIALRYDPDWFTTDVGYSRYNLISAINTINSLPDCSEYTASYGANTIKFKGDAGSKTSTTWAGDTPINIGSGAINKLTDEQIAVAAAKGWTVAIV